MPNITDAAQIPTGKRAAVKSACLKFGPALLGDDFPQTNGVAKTDLTNAEVALVFEKITRRFWRDLLQQDAVEAAVETARTQAVAATATDPFA